MNSIKRLFKNIFKSKKLINDNETDIELKKIEEGIGVNELLFSFNHINTYLPYEPVLKEPEFFRIIKKCFGHDNVKFNFTFIEDEFRTPLYIVGNKFEIYMNDVNKIYYKRRTGSNPIALEKIICFNLFNEYIFHLYPVYTSNDIKYVCESRLSYMDDENIIEYSFSKFGRKPLFLQSDVLIIYKINFYNILKL